MSWLRLDDRFAEHGKLMKLARKDRWTWIELLCYCSRHQNGNIPKRIREILHHVTPVFLDQCIAAGLVERDEQGGLAVHDWAKYNPADPTGAERASRYRHGKRHGAVTDESREPSRGASRKSNAPHALARARGPSPKDKQPTNQSTSREDRRPVHVWQDIDDLRLDPYTELAHLEENNE